MADSYTLNWDLAKKQLQFSMTGTWDDATMKRWDADYRAAVAKAPAGGWTVLGDLSEYPPQSDPIQQGHEALMAYSATKGMTKAALIVPKMVLAMQMKRLAVAAAVETIAFVGSRSEADQKLAA